MSIPFYTYIKYIFKQAGPQFLHTVKGFHLILNNSV